MPTIIVEKHYTDNPIEKPYLKTSSNIVNLSVVISNLVICVLVYAYEIQDDSTRKWTAILAVLGLLFNGLFFVLDNLHIKTCNSLCNHSVDKDYPPTFILLFTQLLLSVLWAFFYLTSALDLTILSAKEDKVIWGIIIITFLAFLTMFLYVANVTIKYKIIEIDVLKWPEEKKKIIKKARRKIRKNYVKELFGLKTSEIQSNPDKEIEDGKSKIDTFCENICLWFTKRGANVQMDEKETRMSRKRRAASLERKPNKKISLKKRKTL